MRGCFSRLHGVLKEYQAWSIIPATIAVGIASCQWSTDRGVREATLFALASARLADARALDRADGHGEPHSNLGQIRVLEEMATLGIGMSRINASLTYLHRIRLPDANLSEADFEEADLGVANLSGADLRFAQFTDANLSFADLSGAKLASAVFDGATLHCTDFSGASFYDVEFEDGPPTQFSRARLHNADFSVTDLRTVVGLTPDQLKQACGESVRLANNELTIQPCSQRAQRQRYCERARNLYRRP